MAHKKKIRRYRKGGPARLDMRKGGRVALQRGGPRRRPSKAQVLAEAKVKQRGGKRIIHEPKTKVKQRGRRGKAENVRSESGRLQNQPQEQEASIDQIRRQQKLKQRIPEAQRGILAEQIKEAKRPQPLYLRNGKW